MSRRASLVAKAKRERLSVRFSDEIVFQDSVKENDIPCLLDMLRRNSLQIDVNTINQAGLSALHQAVCDGNVAAVKLLINHQADVNLFDEDTWTPLHAACSNGFSEIARCLIENGADPFLINSDGERPIDLADPTDFETIGVMLQHMNENVNHIANEDDTAIEASKTDCKSDELDQTGDDESEKSDDEDAKDYNETYEKSSSRLERISSKYLDSDDENMEYVSENENENEQFHSSDDDISTCSSRLANGDDDMGACSARLSNDDDETGACSARLSNDDDSEHSSIKNDNTLRRQYNNNEIDNCLQKHFTESESNRSHSQSSENSHGIVRNHSFEYVDYKASDRISRESDDYANCDTSDANSVFDSNEQIEKYSDISDADDHNSRFYIQSSDPTESDRSRDTINKDSGRSIPPTESEASNAGKEIRSSQEESGSENLSSFSGVRDNEMDVMMASHVAVKNDKSGRIYTTTPY